MNSDIIKLTHADTVMIGYDSATSDTSGNAHIPSSNHVVRPVALRFDNDSGSGNTDNLYLNICFGFTINSIPLILLLAIANGRVRTDDTHTTIEFNWNALMPDIPVGAISFYNFTLNVMYMPESGDPRRTPFTVIYRKQIYPEAFIRDFILTPQTLAMQNVYTRTAAIREPVTSSKTIVCDMNLDITLCKGFHIALPTALTRLTLTTNDYQIYDYDEPRLPYVTTPTLVPNLIFFPFNPDSNKTTTSTFRSDYLQIRLHFATPVTSAHIFAIAHNNLCVKSGTADIELWRDVPFHA